jgi:hypothetical protein
VPQNRTFMHFLCAYPVPITLNYTRDCRIYTSIEECQGLASAGLSVSIISQHMTVEAKTEHMVQRSLNLYTYYAPRNRLTKNVKRV